VSYDFDSFLYSAFEPLRAVEPTPNEIRAILERTRRRRWRLRRRRTLAVALAALAIGGGATAALLDRDAQIDNQVRNQGPFESSGDPALDRLIAEARTKPALAPIADTFSVEVRAADPAGGPDWVLVVWRSETGGWCNVPARERGAEIGVLDESGQFTPFPFHTGGACTPAPLAADTAHVAAISYPGGPTILHGVAGRRVVHIHVTGLEGLSEVTPSKRGGLMVVLPQATRSPTLDVELELDDGTRQPLVGRG
jgi:hypothetical protein